MVKKAYTCILFHISAEYDYVSFAILGYKQMQIKKTNNDTNHTQTQSRSGGLLVSV